MSALFSAVRAYRATLTPPEPPDAVEELIAAGNELLASGMEFATAKAIKQAHNRWNAAKAAVAAARARGGRT